jgi:hypothetical protein
MEDIGTVTTTSYGSFAKVKYTLLSVNDNELSKKKNAKLYEDIANRIVNMPLENEQYNMQIEAMGYEISGLEDVINKQKEMMDIKDEIMAMQNDRFVMMNKSLNLMRRAGIASTAVMATAIILLLIFS